MVEPLPMNVKILIHSCVDLHASDLNGKSDPYVKFWWQGTKYKTVVIRKNLNPTWNQSFIIEYHPGKDQRIVHIEVWDKDRIKKNDPLGKVALDLPKLRETGTSSDTWYPIPKLKGTGKGQMRLKVDFYYLEPPVPKENQQPTINIQLGPNPSANAFDLQCPSPQGYYPNQLPPGSPRYSQLGYPPQGPLSPQRDASSMSASTLQFQRDASSMSQPQRDPSTMHQPQRDPSTMNHPQRDPSTMHHPQRDPSTMHHPQLDMPMHQPQRDPSTMHQPQRDPSTMQQPQRDKSAMSQPRRDSPETSPSLSDACPIFPASPNSTLK